MPKLAKPILIVDTREQTPYAFTRFEDQFASIERRTLKTGDYSMEGYEGRICIERKSLTDLVNTLIHNWERFNRECVRMNSFEYAAVVIESDLHGVSSPYPFSQANPNSVIGRLQSISLLYNIHVIFADNRIASEAWIANTLLKFHKYSQEQRG